MDYTSQWIDSLKYPHHRQSVLNLRDELMQDPSVKAVILGGSVCHGYERADSDIDCMILLDEEEFDQRCRENTITYYTTALTPYDGGYVDGKYQSLAYLQKVAHFGAEPARYAYKDSRIILSHVEGLDRLLAEVTAYPEHDRENRIRRFHAQLDGLRWFFGEGEKRNDRYTINWSSTGMVLFGSRMLLAYNRVLFPCNKTMTHELKRCAELPEGIFEKMEELLAQPTTDAAEAYYRAIKDWRQWEVPPAGWPAQYIEDSEMKWLTGFAPIADI